MNKNVLTAAGFLLFLFLNLPAIAVQIQQDTVNCLDSNNVFYLKNEFNKAISIDSIYIQLASPQGYVGTYLTIDTGNIFFHSLTLVFLPHFSFSAVIRDSQIVIAAKDSLRFRNIKITALATHASHIYHLILFDSNGGKDSVYVIANYNTIGKIMFQTPHPNKLITQKSGRVCTLNGRTSPIATNQIQMYGSRLQLIFHRESLP